MITVLSSDSDTDRKPYNSIIINEKQLSEEVKRLLWKSVNRLLEHWFSIKILYPNSIRFAASEPSNQSGELAEVQSICQGIFSEKLSIPSLFSSWSVGKQASNLVRSFSWVLPSGIALNVGCLWFCGIKALARWTVWLAHSTLNSFVRFQAWVRSVAHFQPKKKNWINKLIHFSSLPLLTFSITFLSRVLLLALHKQTFYTGVLDHGSCELKQNFSERDCRIRCWPERERAANEQWKEQINLPLLFASIVNSCNEITDLHEIVGQP